VERNQNREQKWNKIKGDSCSRTRDGAQSTRYTVPMITVLIRVRHGAEALAVTLGALVPAVIDGLIGDAVVVTPTPDGAVAAIAEAAGATLVVASDDSWRKGAALARRDWVFCLEDGDVPTEGWMRVLDRFVTLSPVRSFGRLTRRPRGLREALAESLRRRLGTRTVRSGDLVHRSIWLRLEAGGSPVHLGALIERDPVLG
jgi:hypothetical protein